MSDSVNPASPSSDLLSSRLRELFPMWDRKSKPNVKRLSINFDIAQFLHHEKINEAAAKELALKLKNYLPNDAQIENQQIFTRSPGDIAIVHQILTFVSETFTHDSEKSFSALDDELKYVEILETQSGGVAPAEDATSLCPYRGGVRFLLCAAPCA